MIDERGYGNAALIPPKQNSVGAQTARRADPRMITPLPSATIERLADLWCEALLSNLRRHRMALLTRDGEAA